MPDHVSARDRVDSAPWFREPLGQVLPSAEPAGLLALLFARPAVIAGTVAGLYLVATLLLFGTMGHLPDYAFNWEEYTAHDVLAIADGQVPLTTTFRLTDGLMTDSGRLPWVAIPTSWLFDLDEISLMALRLPSLLLSALAVPLTFLLGRMLAGPGTGLLGAALVALSPAFLVYGRTGTVVGLSVSLALLTALLLLVVLQSGRRPLSARIVALLALQAALVAGAYAYSPIRLFWLIAIVLLVVEALFQRDRRGWLLSALAITVVTIPAFVTLMLGFGQSDRAAAWNLRSALAAYFNAGGEQLASFVEYPNSFRSFLPPEAATGTTGDLAWNLVQRNVSALVALLADQDTRPPLTDFWNTHGQLYSSLLVPLAVVGGVLLLSQLLRSVEARFLVVGFAGLTLPLLATSQVHLGRLVFASPYLMIVVAVGLVWLTGLLIVHLPNAILRLTRNDRGAAGRHLASVRVAIRVGLALVLVGAVAVQAWQTDRVWPMASQSHTPEVVDAIRAQRDAGTPAVALVLSVPNEHNFEQLDVATYRLMMDREARFIDALDAPSGSPAPAETGRIDVFSGSLAGEGTATVERLPGDGCEVVYLIAETLAPDFQSALDDLDDRCDQPPLTVPLAF